MRTSFFHYKQSAFICAFLFLLTFSCASRKIGQSESRKNSPETKTLRVEFFSRGSGIDGKLRKQFLEFETEYRKKQNITEAPLKQEKGREGEVNYCYTFSNWKKENIQEFMNKLKELLSSSDLVRMQTNVPCK
jgi:hypothetical protein